MILIEKLLELLKETTDYLSGEELGERLGVSRTAVWKMVAKLREMGYSIEAATNRGYRFVSNEGCFNQIEIKQGLKTDKIGCEVLFFEEVDSTNNVARRLAAENYPDGTVVISEIQNAGKGRIGRIWNSPKGTGIWMSLILRPEVSPKDASKLTLLAGLSVCKAVRDVTGLLAGIKWPNDVLINNKKICGILTEMNAEMDQIYSIIVGIGINVNNVSFPPELENIATSLKIEDGRHFSRNKIVQAVLMEFEKNYRNYILEQNYNAFLEEYKKYSVTLQKEVRVIGNESFTGTAVGLSADGELIIRKKDGQEVLVFSGEVSIRPGGEEGFQ